MISGKLRKAQITNRGYNKFLTLSGEVTVAIDEEKVKKRHVVGWTQGVRDEHRTCSQRSHRALQSSLADRKGIPHLKNRFTYTPHFHYKRRRIEAHMCIAFVAYSIWKELERLLDKNGICMSPRRRRISPIQYTR